MVLLSGLSVMTWANFCNKFLSFLGDCLQIDRRSMERKSGNGKTTGENSSQIYLIFLLYCHIVWIVCLLACIRLVVRTWPIIKTVVVGHREYKALKALFKNARR